MDFSSKIEGLEGMYEDEISALNEEVSGLEEEVYGLKHEVNGLENEIGELQEKLEVAGHLIKAMEAAFKNISESDIGDDLDIACASCAHNQECSKMWRRNKTSLCIQSEKPGDGAEWVFDVDKWSQYVD